jgi:hypothetical protein
MEHPYEYGEWVEDALADLYYIQQYAADCRAKLERGREVPQDYLNHMAELSEKVQRTFDRQLALQGE